ncbi:MAG TPA: hypothetical protein PL033_08335 [Candidatus Brocadiia bacterium]|nr:hypothetical protein [Candidatus Brocadiia bacterium]
MDAKKARKETPRGLKLLHSFTGHRSDIARVAWSPDGCCLASSSYDRTLRVWDVKAGQALRTLSGHTDVVFGLAWSPDSRRIVSASWDGTARVWDAVTGREVRVLKGHIGPVNCVSWSPDGSVIATASGDGTIRLWDAESEDCLCKLPSGKAGVFFVSWTSSGRGLASISEDSRISLWDAENSRLLWTFQEEKREVKSLRIAPDESFFAVGTEEGAIEIWTLGGWDVLITDSTRSASSESGNDTTTGQIQPSTAGAHAEHSNPCIVRKMIFKAHSGAVTSLSFSSDGRMMASKSNDGSIRIWRADTWEAVAALEESVGRFCPPGLEFHPRLPALATLGEQNLCVRIWKLDDEWLIPPHLSDIHYANAKALVLGDSGSGKTALVNALCGSQAQPPRGDGLADIRLMERVNLETQAGQQAWRETLLWDIHDNPVNRAAGSLQMTGASAAIIVYDGRRETNRMAGVRRWYRMLESACKACGRDISSLKIILAANKSDLGPSKVSSRITDKLRRELGIGPVIECSARTGDKISDLADAVRTAIDWDEIPSVSSPHLVQMIADYVREWRDDGRVINTRKKFITNFMDRLAAEDKQGTAEPSSAGVFGERLRGKLIAFTDRLKGEMTQREEPTERQKTEAYHLTPLDAALPPIWVCRAKEQAAGSSLLGATMLRGGARRVEDKPSDTELAVEKARSLWRERPESLKTLFEFCIELAETRGIIRRFAYGDLLLTRPAMFYDYAGMIVEAASGEPDGLALIEEKTARTGEFGIPENKRIANLDQERLMLVGTVEELLLHGIAIREPSDMGPLLIVPSRFGAELPDKPQEPKSSLVIRFGGAVTSVYARLIARLSRQKGLSLGEVWSNEACFHDEKEAPFRIHLTRLEEDSAELKLNFDLKIDRAARLELERFIYRHLKHRSCVDKLEFYRPLNCAECGATFSAQQLEYRIERGYDWISCSVCETRAQIREDNVGRGCEAGASDTRLRVAHEEADEPVASKSSG